MENVQNHIKFSRKDSTKFFRLLNKRVNNYFKENNIKKTGNWKLHLKAIAMFSLFLTPYFLILTLDISQWWMLLLTVIMGAGMAGVGMNIMHDGNHGSYSSKKWVTNLWAAQFMCWPETFITGRCNIMYYTILIQIFT